MSEDLVMYERYDASAILTINRPEKLNAMDLPMIDALESAVDEAESDPEVRVLIFTGAGDRAFAAGGDIDDLNSRMGLSHYQQFAERIHQVFRKIELIDKPTIAAINGWALGGGTELLLSIDIRLVARSAKLGLPEITLGLFPGAGGTQRLIRQIPLCRAKEIMFTGDHISAEEAKDLGLVNRVIDDGDLMKEAKALAEVISNKSPLTLKLLKRTIEEGAQINLASALKLEQAMISLVMDSNDAHEGCSAFLDRRTPDFKGE